MTSSALLRSCESWRNCSACAEGMDCVFACSLMAINVHFMIAIQRMASIDCVFCLVGAPQIQRAALTRFWRQFNLRIAARPAVRAGHPFRAEVAELADAHGSGPCTRKGVGVRVPSSAPIKKAHRHSRRRLTLFAYFP